MQSILSPNPKRRMNPINMKSPDLITSNPAQSQFVQNRRSWLIRTRIAGMIACLSVLACASASAAVSLVGWTSGNFSGSGGAYTNSGIDLNDTANVLVMVLAGGEGRRRSSEKV